jgi:hypothetical protein
MTLVVETGVGVRGANGYVNTAYVTAYLTARNRQTENSWSTATSAQTDAAIVAATDYVDKRFSNRFKGLPAVTLEDSSATATVTFTGLPSDSEALTIGDETWTFVSALSGATYEVLIGATAAGTAANLEAALNGADGAGTTYGLATPQSRHVSASAASAVLTLTATAPGASGALTVLEGSVTNVTIGTFSGGLDGGIQPLSWPRNYAYDERGSLIEGIPDRLKMAVSEYAVRAVSATLLPDPTVDPYAGSVQGRTEKVGPIEETYEYVAGTAGKITFKPYPAADKILRPLLLGSGGVIRG